MGLRGYWPGPVEVAATYDLADITAPLTNRVASRRRGAADGTTWDPRQPLLEGR